MFVRNTRDIHGSWFLEFVNLEAQPCQKNAKRSLVVIELSETSRMQVQICLSRISPGSAYTIQELETLAENGFITDDAFDTIMKNLPGELSLNAARAAPAPTPSPVPTPVNEFQNLRVSNDAPPAYQVPNPPAVPSRQPSNPPSKPELSRAIALYAYNGTESNDCPFQIGDNIAVYEHMNQDWWLGKNLRTGTEGVFPVNYVQVQASNPPPQQNSYGNEKSQNAYGGYPGQNQQPPQPGPVNPYDSSAPPMQMANQPTEPGKGGEMGKKFGKKLGNAAIFGAGATIGSNIVNSIF